VPITRVVIRRFNFFVRFHSYSQPGTNPTLAPLRPTFNHFTPPHVNSFFFILIKKLFTICRPRWKTPPSSAPKIKRER
jgi:hypothetical protein